MEIMVSTVIVMEDAEKDGSVRNAPPTSPLEDKNLYKYEENGKLRFSLPKQLHLVALSPLVLHFHT